MAAKKKIEINGKKYDPVPMNINTVCDLDDMGVSIQDYGKKPLALSRAYLALCMGGVDVSIAGIEIENHIINGGTLDTISDAIKEQIEESGFFRTLSQNAETKN